MSELTKAQKKKKRKGCWGCSICDAANKKFGKCVAGICACHLRGVIMPKPTKARSGQTVPTLDKAQEKRFDEKFPFGVWGRFGGEFTTKNKQHLAKELSIQKKEIYKEGVKDGMKIGKKMYKAK